MKRIIGMVVLCAFLLLGGCGKEEQPAFTEYRTTIFGQESVVTFPRGNPSEGTIQVGQDTYTYAYGMDGTLTINYPDGVVYSQKETNGAIMASGPDNGFSLAWAVSDAVDSVHKTTGKQVSPVSSVLVLAMGIWFAFFPQSAWWLARGMWYKDAKPSDLALVLYRLGGGGLLLVGVISLFV